MNFLKSFLLLIFFTGFVSAANVSVDDVGSVHVFIENQRDTVIKVDVLKEKEDCSINLFDDACCLKKGDVKRFYLESPIRKRWRLEKILLGSTDWIIDNFIRIFDSNDDLLYEFNYATKLKRQNFNSNQENFSILFVLNKWLEKSAERVFEREFNGNVLSFDLADIYFVKIVITNQGADVNLVQKILKIGGPMPKLEFSENKF